MQILKNYIGWEGGCLKGNSCTAAGGGAELCGCFSPHQEELAPGEPPVIPDHWGHDFSRGGKGRALLMA